MASPFVPTSAPNKISSTDVLQNMRTEFNNRKGYRANSQVNVANVTFAREMKRSRTKKQQTPFIIPQFTRLSGGGPTEPNKPVEKKRRPPSHASPAPVKPTQVVERVSLNASNNDSFFTSSKCWGVVAAVGILLIFVLLCTGKSP